jgi:hypothetical protein
VTRDYRSARDQQLVTDACDDILTILARSTNPRVKHWWGRRTWPELIPASDLMEGAADKELGGLLASRHGAWCYLCAEPITSWSSSWPMTEGARYVIALHRLGHIRDDLDVVRAESEGKT